jgi:hypothetical protein
MAAAGSAAPGGPDPTDLSQAFKLHSRPGAQRTILLDFTGHTTTGTVWNVFWGPSIVTPPFDMDGNSASFSDGERLTIITAWRAVAEDYAPFDVGARLVVDTGGGGRSWGWLQLLLARPVGAEPARLKAASRCGCFIHQTPFTSSGWAARDCFSGPSCLGSQVDPSMPPPLAIPPTHPLTHSSTLPVAPG